MQQEPFPRCFSFSWLYLEMISVPFSTVNMSRQKFFTNVCFSRQINFQMLNMVLVNLSPYKYTSENVSYTAE